MVHHAPSLPSEFRIHSAADLEIALMYEAHDLLARIVSPSLYRVSGAPPEQQAAFKSRETFELFAIRLGEFLSPAARTVTVPSAPADLSLLSGLEWAAQRLKEPSARELSERVMMLRTWVGTVDRGRFWCGALTRQFEIAVERDQLLRTFANLRKYTPFRLATVMAKLQRWTAAADHSLLGTEVPDVLEAFHEWLSGYAEYHSTMVAELLGHVFFALNRVVWEQWDANGRTNDSRRIAHPNGTSPVYEQVHTSRLVFKRYDDARITGYTPSTASSFRQLYDV